jgi:hypothetical protein
MMIANGAHVVPSNNQGLCKTASPITLTGVTNPECFDPDHSHSPSWLSTYDYGNMDGACTINVTVPGSCSLTQCPGGNSHYCPYTFVSNSTGLLSPYFQIAEQYGFANWMFQTSQGPSQLAHLFLFSGTSAPVYDDGDSFGYWKWFAAENSNMMHVAAGCTAPTGSIVLEEPPPPMIPYGQPAEGPGYNGGYPCYNHNTLTTLLESNNITWRYYSASSPGGNGDNIWNAPSMIQNICMSSGPSGTCTGSDYASHVVGGNPGAVLQDLGVGLAVSSPCTLQNVTWVIPDGNWSDHPGLNATDAGPSWVASIVNAVGGYDNSGNQLADQCFDTINGQQVPYFQDTVVLVVWDDWGGFYDDVLPWRCQAGPDGECTGYLNGSGSQYVYGFRVPLLVVSAYTKYTGTCTSGPCVGYVSGACNPSTGSCAGDEVAPYVHDFGSILNFVEYAFGTNQQALGYPNGIAQSNYQYADYFAPDSPTGGCSGCAYSLQDFFSFGQLPRTFTPITGAVYPTSCFVNPGNSSCFGTMYPADPDDDEIDPQ